MHARLKLSAGAAALAWFALPVALHAQKTALLDRIWNGVQQAQARTATACGTVAETRSSPLMTRPLVLHGRFCAEGAIRFWLEYLPPHALTVRFDTDDLTVTGGDGATAVFQIGGGVRRAQSAFSRASSLDGLKKDFTIAAEENERVYELRFAPRAAIYRRRLNLLVVQLDKRTFLPRSIEVDGKSGVDSVFSIDITSTNRKLPGGIFEEKKK